MNNITTINTLDPNRIPEHIAIIMDGNGRWANEHGKPRSYGHQMGVETVRKITSECTRLGVKFLTLYTFSTENWNRPATEVAALMGLVLSSLEDEIFMKNNVRFRVIGDMGRLPDEVQQKLRETEEHTKDNTAMTMVVALSYSARWEIVKAVKDIVDEKWNPLISRRIGYHRGSYCPAFADKFHARSRLADPHGRGAAREQFPALANSLFGVVLLRYLLARL